MKVTRLLAKVVDDDGLSKGGNASAARESQLGNVSSSSSSPLRRAFAAALVLSLLLRLLEAQIRPGKQP